MTGERKTCTCRCPQGGFSGCVAASMCMQQPCCRCPAQHSTVQRTVASSGDEQDAGVIVALDGSLKGGAEAAPTPAETTVTGTDTQGSCVTRCGLPWFSACLVPACVAACLCTLLGAGAPFSPFPNPAADSRCCANVGDSSADSGMQHTCGRPAAVLLDPVCTHQLLEVATILRLCLVLSLSR